MTKRFLATAATFLTILRTDAFVPRSIPASSKDASGTWTSSRRYSLGSTTSLLAVSTLVDIDERAPRDLLTMDRWASACGVQRAGGFQLTTNDGVDIYAITTQDIPANSPVLFIPSQMVLSSNRAAQEFGRLQDTDVLLETLELTDQIRYFYLMVKILVEYQKGQDSPWFPWLNALPRFYTNGASMTSVCYECLPPFVRSLSLKERTNLLCLDVRKVPFLSDQTKRNKELIKWAFQIVYTRAFEANDGSGDLRIAPLADFFNHGTETEIALMYDAEGNCYAQSIRDVPAGSPLRMSYGDPTHPSFLFARYGFVDETAPATFCKIIIPHVTKELEDIGYAHNRMLFYRESGEASEEVWDVLLYRLLGEIDDKEQRRFYTAHVNRDLNTKQAMHQQYWPQTSKKLLDHIDDFLAQLSVLVQKASGKTSNDHPRLPLISKHNEIVKETFLKVKARYFSV